MYRTRGGSLWSEVVGVGCDILVPRDFFFGEAMEFPCFSSKGLFVCARAIFGSAECVEMCGRVLSVPFANSACGRVFNFFCSQNKAA